MSAKKVQDEQQQQAFKNFSHFELDFLVCSSDLALFGQAFSTARNFFRKCSDIYQRGTEVTDNTKPG